MKFFLLFIILKLLNANWAAPLDRKGTNETLSNKTLSSYVNANNLIRDWENLVNSTESALTETINEGLRKVAEKLQNFTVETEKYSEENLTKKFSDKESAKTDENLIGSTTALQENTKSINEFQSFAYSTGSPQDILSASYVKTELPVTRAINDNSFNLSNVLAQTHCGRPSTYELNNEMLVNETSFQSENKTQKNFNTSSATDVEPDDVATTTQQYENMLEHTTQYLEPESFVKASSKIINEDELSTDAKFKKLLKQAPTFKQAVDSFIEDVVEIGSQLGLIGQKAMDGEMQTASETLSKNKHQTVEVPAKDKSLEKTQSPATNQTLKLIETITEGVNSVLADSSSTVHSASSHHDPEIADNSVTPVNDFIPVTQQYENTEKSKSSTHLLESELNKSGSHKPELSLHSNVNDDNKNRPSMEKESNANSSSKVGTVGQGNEEKAKEREINSSRAQPSTQNTKDFHDPLNSYEKIARTVLNRDSKPEEFYKQNITLEIRDKSGLIPQNTTSNQTPLSTTKVYEETNQINATPLSTLGLKSNEITESTKTVKLNYKLKATDDRWQGVATTTPFSWEESTDNQDNKIIGIKVSNISNLSQSFDHLVGSASFKVKETVGEFLSQENTTEALNQGLGSTTEEINYQEQTTFGNPNSSYNIISTEMIPENAYGTTTKTLIIDRNYIDKYTKTEIPIESLPTTDGNTNMFKKEIGDEHINYVQISSVEAEKNNITKQLAQPVEIAHRIRENVTNGEPGQHEILESQISIGPTKYPEFTLAQRKKQASDIKENKIYNTNEGLSTTYYPSQTNTFTTLMYTPILQTITEAYFDTEETTTSLNQEEQNYSISSETSQQKPSTLAPNLPAFTTLMEEFTASSTTEATTFLPQKFEEESHFQLNTSGSRQAFDNSNIWEAAENKQPYPTKITNEINTPNTPQVSDAITKNFVKPTDNYDKTFIDSFSTIEKGNQLTKAKEKITPNAMQTTETSFIFTTMLTSAEQLRTLKTQDDTNETADVKNEVKHEDIVSTTAETNMEESTEIVVPNSTESITKATTLEPAVSMSLRKYTHSAATNTTFKTIITEPPTENVETKKELFTTVKPMVSRQEKTTQPYTENSLEEMVAFIEQIDTQNNTETLTRNQAQAAEIITTTELNAPIHSNAASGQAATTANREESTEQETTEAEINSTTLVEENEATVTSTEMEARSLSLPPPKLEYSQNEDGVEVFYGYSLVKHN